MTSTTSETSCWESSPAILSCGRIRRLFSSFVQVVLSLSCEVLPFQPSEPTSHLIVLHHWAMRVLMLALIFSLPSCCYFSFGPYLLEELQASNLLKDLNQATAYLSVNWMGKRRFHSLAILYSLFTQVGKPSGLYHCLDCVADLMVDLMYCLCEIVRCESFIGLMNWLRLGFC